MTKYSEKLHHQPDDGDGDGVSVVCSLAAAQPSVAVVSRTAFGAAKAGYTVKVLFDPPLEEHCQICKETHSYAHR